MLPRRRRFFDLIFLISFDELFDVHLHKSVTASLATFKIDIFVHMHVGHSQSYVPAHAVLPLTLQIKVMVPFVYGGFKGIKALHSHQAELKLW